MRRQHYHDSLRPKRQLSVIEVAAVHVDYRARPAERKLQLVDRGSGVVKDDLVAGDESIDHQLFVGEPAGSIRATAPDKDVIGGNAATEPVVNAGYHRVEARSLVATLSEVLLNRQFACMDEGGRR